MAQREKPRARDRGDARERLGYVAFMMGRAEHGITIRRPALEYPADLDPVVIEGNPEESYVVVGLSLLLPYLEPYLIRSMQAAKPRVTDPALREQLALFNGQEGQHYRQHIRFNEAIRREGFPELPALEAEVARDYRRFTATRSLRWNLAYAEGFEAYTSAMARFSFEEGTLEGMHPAVRALYEWHLVEELEHRNVAFDVYDHVCGGWLYRLIVGLYAQWHLNRFVLRVAASMLRADPEAFRKKYGGFAEAWKRVRPRLWLILRRLMPKIMATYLPWYTPHRLGMPEGARALAAGYAEAAPRPVAGEAAG
jgi:predicted metal-dependent hydrolase